MTNNPDPAHTVALQGIRPLRRLAWLTDLHLDFAAPRHSEKFLRVPGEVSTPSGGTPRIARSSPLAYNGGAGRVRSLPGAS